MAVVDHLLRYARRIRDLRRANAAAPEPAVAPAFQELLSDLLLEVPGGAGLSVVPEFLNPGSADRTLLWRAPGRRHGPFCN